MKKAIIDIFFSLLFNTLLFFCWIYKVIITEDAIKKQGQPELLRLAANETRPVLKVKKSKKKKGVETA